MLNAFIFIKNISTWTGKRELYCLKQKQNKKNQPDQFETLSEVIKQETAAGTVIRCRAAGNKFHTFNFSAR